MSPLSRFTLRRRAGAAPAAALAATVAVALTLGAGAGAAQAGPVAPPVSGYTYASFVVPTQAQNGGAALLPVQGLISRVASPFSLRDYSARMICNGTSFYPLNLTTYGGGTISFTGYVPIVETGHTCLVTAYSALPGQQVQFQPSQTYVASEFLPTAVVNILAEVVSHSATGGL